MGNFWDVFWLIAEAFMFIAYLFVLFYIYADLFRNHEMSGISKAIWVIGLIMPVPFVALAYILIHGRGMAQRQQQAMARMKSESDNYIRQIAGKSPAEQISDAKELLNAGTITADEFAQLKAKALA
jgi:ABC-type multidrug transport system fused ATPase/permease subunit